MHTRSECTCRFWMTSTSGQNPTNLYSITLFFSSSSSTRRSITTTRVSRAFRIPFRSGSISQTIQISQTEQGSLQVVPLIRSSRFPLPISNITAANSDHAKPQKSKKNPDHRGFPLLHRGDFLFAGLVLEEPTSARERHTRNVLCGGRGPLRCGRVRHNHQEHKQRIELVPS